jgi:hypothetical protein
MGFVVLGGSQRARGTTFPGEGRVAQWRRTVRRGRASEAQAGRV